MKIKRWMLYLLLVWPLIPATAPAAEFDGSKSLICALKDNFECGPDGCERVTSEAINLPQFLRLNFTEKQITTIREGVQVRTTKMERAETLESSLFVQGLENNLAWSLVIDKAAGKMVMTIAGDQVGFVVFGACTTP